jgi:hypothetical protein
MMEIYDQLNKDWRSVTKVLFGVDAEGIGELKDYGEYLSEYNDAPSVEKSAVSGKDTYLAIDEYCDGAKFIGLDEVDFNKRFEPLNINEIKDVDSIVGAVKERIYYTGNLVLGNSKFVEGSSNITDGVYIYKSCLLDECQHAAYSSYIRRSKYIFGCTSAAFLDHVVRGHEIGPYVNRCFEVYLIMNSSDTYYSANLDGCAECLFCFNLRGRRHNIGNLELPKDKYAIIKSKLLSEMAEDIKRKKSKRSLFNILSSLPKEKVVTGADQEDVSGKSDQSFDLAPIDKAFRQTFNVILKKEPSGLEAYAGFLQKKRVPKIVPLSGAASKNEVLFANVFRYLTPEKIPTHRLIDASDAVNLSKNPPSLSMDEVEDLSLEDDGSMSKLSKMAFMPFSLSFGQNRNVGRDIWTITASDCYNGVAYIYSKLCAYTFWPRDSSYIFGSSTVFDSSFCINSYYSKNLSRTFEVDGCRSCSDAYFLHNCENMRDSMFCFNVKNMNYAIGNAALGPEDYRRIKASLIEQIGGELVEKKDFKWDIYNIGCGKP